MVTISRQAGAGGDEIARLLAEELGWKLLDNEAVEKLLAGQGVSLRGDGRLRGEEARFLASLSLREGEVPSLPEAGELRVRATGRLRHPGQGRPGPVRERAGHRQGQDHRSPAGPGRQDARAVGRGRTRDTPGHPAFGQRAGRVPSLPVPCRLGLSRSLRPGHQHPRHPRAGRGRPGDRRRSAPGKPRSTRKAAARRIEDLFLAQKATVAILYEQKLPIRFLEVDVDGGSVTLRGTARDQPSIERSREVASRVTNAKRSRTRSASTRGTWSCSAASSDTRRSRKSVDARAAFPRHFPTGAAFSPVRA